MRIIPVTHMFRSLADGEPDRSALRRRRPRRQLTQRAGHPDATLSGDHLGLTPDPSEPGRS